MKITSSALFFVFGWTSTGMPRPSSSMVIDEPSLCRVTRMFDGVAVHRLVDRVVERFPDEVMEAGAADAADVHAGALANRLEAFEDGDVFGGVGSGHSGSDYSGLGSGLGACRLGARCLSAWCLGARGQLSLDAWASRTVTHSLKPSRWRFFFRGAGFFSPAARRLPRATGALGPGSVSAAAPSSSGIATGSAITAAAARPVQRGRPRRPVAGDCSRRGPSRAAPTRARKWRRWRTRAARPGDRARAAGCRPSGRRASSRRSIRSAARRNPVVRS